MAGRSSKRKNRNGISYTPDSPVRTSQDAADKPGRRIKQVYLTDETLSGDRRSENWHHGYDDDDTQIYNPDIHGHKLGGHENVREYDKKTKHRTAIRIALVSIVLVLSMFLSSVVGAALALWDSDRTVSDLTGILFPSVVMASTEDVEGNVAVQSEDSNDSITMRNSESDDGLDSEKVPESIESVEATESGENLETVEQIPEEETESAQPQEEMSEVQPQEAQTVQQDEVDYNELMNQIMGIDSYIKAGQEDELVSIENDRVATAVYADPNTNYPLSFTKVDESYFTDALFIGDSRMQGFGLWSGLPATFYCATGFQMYKIDTTKVVQTENGKVPIFDALPYDAFTKIYIKVGLNEMGWGSEQKFEELYASVIERLREREPRAIIYIHGLLPVTAEKSATDGSHNNSNIEARNAALAEFAVTQKAYFVNAGEALVGPDGCLPAEMTGDGIHLKSQYMPIWKDYLLSHAVVIR